MALGSGKYLTDDLTAEIAISRREVGRGHVTGLRWLAQYAVSQRSWVSLGCGRCSGSVGLGGLQCSVRYRDPVNGEERCLMVFVKR